MLNFIYVNIFFVNKSLIKFLTDFGPLIIFFYYYYDSDKDLKIAIPPFIIATIIALIINGDKNLFEGKCMGNITQIKSGLRGFGYDPIFMPYNSNRTFANMKKEEKGLISHRGKAVKKLIKFLTSA